MEYKSGFICPQCHFVASDGPELAAHFEKEHETSGAKHKAQQQALTHFNLSVGRSRSPPGTSTTWFSVRMRCIAD